MNHDDDIVRLDRDGSVAVLTLNDPDSGNAFEPAMHDRLLSLLRRLSDVDDGCRAIVITGAGGTFCAGGAVTETAEGGTMALRQRQQRLVDIARAMVGGPRPVVAAVEGEAIGPGLSLAAASDVVVASEGARFGADFVRLGVLPDIGVLWTLAQKVGAGRARELLLDAASVDARQAVALGLAGRLVPAGQARDAALGLAHQLARQPPVAMALLKAALAGGCDSLEQTFETEIDLQPILRSSADHLEALRAFLEKRKPVFIGR